MADDNYRRERIERLLHELEYEITRGMLEHEIDEEMGFRFVVPISRKIPNGVVQCEFRTRPVTHYTFSFDHLERPKLRVVGDESA